MVLAFVCLLTGALLSSESNEPNLAVSSVKVYVIPCKDMIDDGLFESIKRRTQIALDDGAKYLIYEIGTYGGLVKSADDIAKYFILDVGKKVRTVAYVTSEAISAGAMISVSCQDIVMLENTTIGDCAPITIGGGELKGVEREKTESFVRAAFDRAAEANHYPAALLRAMVTMQIEVYQIKNLETGENEYFEGDKLPDDPNVYDLKGKQLVDNKEQILTLTASKAHEYGIARAQVEDLQGVLSFLSNRDSVTFIEGAKVLEPNWSEQMVRWINSPTVMGILVMVALLGLYVEFNTPGLGLPGLMAVICFVIIIGSKYLVGMANWLEVAFFVLGIVLLLIEIFVLPGFGVAGISGILCILGGLFGMLIKNQPDEIPWPNSPLDWELFTDGVLGLVFGFFGFIVFAMLLAKYLHKIPGVGKLVLSPSFPRRGAGISVSMTGTAEVGGAGVNVGDVGEVVTTLRPVGRARFGELIVDVVAVADFLDAGTSVKIIEVYGNRVVVSKFQS
ncbi:MAG: NfeD family protein [Planctomycetota bacterium]